MSQENVQIVRAVFEAWNAGDMDAVRDACDREIIMREPEGFGQEAAMRAFEQLRETFESDWQATTPNSSSHRRVFSGFLLGRARGGDATK